MSADRYFFDTNVLVYSFDAASPAKLRRAQDLIHAGLETGQGIISYQVAQEFIAVARKKFLALMSFEQLEKYWHRTLRPLLAVQSSPSLFTQALDLCRRDRLDWYDSLIVASALQGECKTLYSEDLQHGRRFGDLMVENPFL